MCCCNCTSDVIVSLVVFPSWHCFRNPDALDPRLRLVRSVRLCCKTPLGNVAVSTAWQMSRRRATSSTTTGVWNVFVIRQEQKKWWENARTNAPTGRVDRNCTKSGGKASWPEFLLVGELAQVPHYPETRTAPGGYLHRAWSFGIRPGWHVHEPGTAGRAAVSTGAWVKSKYDMYCIHWSVGG